MHRDAQGWTVIKPNLMKIQTVRQNLELLGLHYGARFCQMLIYSAIAPHIFYGAFMWIVSVEIIASN